MSKRIWKKSDGSINVYTGKNQKAKSAIIALAKVNGFDAFDMVDQVVIESSKKSKLIQRLNKELATVGCQVVANIVEADSLKDYLSDYASMSDSEELKEYLGKMGDQAEDMRTDKATHNLKDCVEDAEQKIAKSEYSEEQISFLKKLSYLSGYEIKDLMSGNTDLEVLLDPDDLEAFENINKTTAKEIGQNEIDFVRSRMGSGLLKHAIFSPEFMEKRKVAIVERALIGAAQESGYPISDFAMWAASEDAGILADELYSEFANLPLADISGMQGKVKNLFIEDMNHYLKSLSRDEYMYNHDEWEEKLGKTSKPRPAGIMKKMKHMFSETDIQTPADDKRRLESDPFGNS